MIVLATRCLAAPADNVAAAGVAFQAAVRAGDADAVAALLHPLTAQEDVVRGSVSQILVNAAAYERAMRAAFGAGASGRFGVASADETEAWAKAKADGATIRLPIVTPPVELKLQRVDNRWKITVASALAYLNAKAAGVAMPNDEPLRRLTQAAQAFREAADTVRAGDHASAAAAADAARLAVDDALQGRGFN